MSYPTWPDGPGPSQSAPDITARVLSANLGDGYAQTTADGLNSISATYSVTWGLLTKTELAAFVAFLAERAGYAPFLWTPPQENAPRQVKCEKWQPKPLGGGWFSLSATFKESFDL